MHDITLITTCKGRLDHLRITLPRMLEQGCRVIVVDYSCPQGTGDWVEGHFAAANVVRVPTQSTFRPSHARNTGAAHAQTQWLCFIDADVFLDSNFGAQTSPRLTDGNFYRFDQSRADLQGTIVCSRVDFDKVGGFDEAFTEWGVEDDDLCQSFAFHGIREEVLASDLATYIWHEDSDRVAHRPVRDRALAWLINRVYLTVKFDMMRLTGSVLTDDIRQSLYGSIRGACIHVSRTHETITFDVNVDHMQLKFNRRHFKAGDVPVEWQCQKKLVYTIGPSMIRDAESQNPAVKSSRHRADASETRRVLINWVYYPAIGHVIEAFRVAQAIRNSNPDWHIAVAVNSPSAQSLHECVNWIDEIYVVDPQTLPTDNPAAGLSHIPQDWDYVFTDARQKQATEWAALNHFCESFRDYINGAVLHDSWPPKQFGSFELTPLVLRPPASARAFAKSFLPPGEKLRVSLLFGSHSESQRTPPIEFWKHLIASFSQHFQNIEFVVFGSFDRTRTQTQGTSRHEIETLAAEFENVTDACNIGLINQLAIAESCQLHISPHTGFSFAVQCLGVPWLSLSGGECAEYFVNGVPFGCIYPTCDRYPCGRFIAPETNPMLPECLEIQGTDQTYSCLCDSLRFQMNNIIVKSELLMRGSLSYHECLEQHWEHMSLRIPDGSPTDFFDGGTRVFEADFLYDANPTIVRPSSTSIEAK